MTCVHLKKLYHLCQQEGLKLGGSDLIHIVCEQCNEKEVCPSVLVDEYDAQEADALKADSLKADSRASEGGASSVNSSSAAGQQSGSQSFRA